MYTLEHFDSINIVLCKQEVLTSEFVVHQALTFLHGRLAARMVHESHLVSRPLVEGGDSHWFLF